MDGYVTISTELDTKDFDAQIDYVKSQLDDIEDKLKKADMGFEVGDTLKLEAQYEKLTQKLKGLIKKKEEFNNQKGLNFSGLKESIDGIGTGIEKVTKKISKMALAVFGIRSAFMFVRNAINTIASDDEQLRTDIDYIKSAIAYTLEPIVRGIVNLVKQLMFYVSYIVKAWTGINIFENANKSLKNANKQAKELKKTTASFDEMNVLSDTTSKDKNLAPSFDLTKMQGEVPDWIKWIADNGDTIIKIIKGIGLALVSLKIGSFLQTLGLFSSLPLWQLVLGIAAVLGGVVMLVKDIVDFISDPSWEGFFNILGDIAIVIGGIMILMGNWWGLLVVIIGAIVKLVANNWDTIMGVLSAVGGWIYDHVIKPVADFFAGLWNGIKKGFEAVWEFILKAFAVGGKIFNGLKDGIVNVFKAIVNALIDGINRLIRVPFDVINGVLNKIRNISILGVAPFKGLWDQNPLPVPQIPKLAVGGIINQPGRGVPIGSAIGGERGAEGVIPLTDSQQMELLGASIGKYITINLTNVNEMNGRVLSRELKRIQSDDDFAYNR